MEVVSYIFSFLLFIILILAIYNSTVIPFYRLFNFGKKVAYINNNKNNFKNKIIKIAGYIFIAGAIVLLLNSTTNSYFITKNTQISASQNYESILLPFVRSFGYIIFIIIIIGSIPRSIKESIYECGLKTESAFVKWNEIKEIKIDDKNNRLLTYYKLRSSFFVKVNECYIIEDYSNDIKNLIYDYWNKEKAKFS